MKDNKKIRKFILGDGHNDRIEVTVEVSGGIDFKNYSVKEAELLEKIRRWMRSVAIESEIEKIDVQK